MARKRSEKAFGKRLDPSRQSEEVEALANSIKYQVVGQERAVEQFIRTYAVLTTRLSRQNRPLGVFLFLGPSGVGKTHAVRALAKALFGSLDAFTRIDCAEYAKEHEVAKLIGSPPGYVGHGDRNAARLAQYKIDKFQTATCKINLVLFDELEKADPALYDMLLGVFDSGKLTMGTGEETDFSRSIIVLTSNLGSRETSALLSGEFVGFNAVSGERHEVDQKIYLKSKEVLRKNFRPEFLNRIDRVVAFRSLSHASMKQILDLEIRAVQSRLFTAGYFISLSLLESAKRFLLKEGWSGLYGARELARTVDRHLAQPVAALIGSKQITEGILYVSYSRGRLVFRAPADPLKEVFAYG